MFYYKFSYEQMFFDVTNNEAPGFLIIPAKRRSESRKKYSLFRFIYVSVTYSAYSVIPKQKWNEQTQALKT